MSEIKSKNRSNLEKLPRKVVDAIDCILAQAVKSGASDIHIDPTSKETIIRLRIDGELEKAGSIEKEMHEEVISRIKILSGARTDIHAVPQDGRYRSDIDGKPFNIRVSFMPTYHGENVVIRLLSAALTEQDSFSSLGFTPDHVRSMRDALDKSSGLILITGPTGSGKTTTLRVCLDIKAKESLSVMTLEDPVEYEVPGVRHVHIRENFGVTFAGALRSALRQDPDVIMVGEIRDAETARTAVHTALTGHLVLSTLHTTSAVETILRLSQMGVENYLIAATLRLIVSQRLVRMICRDCLGADRACSKCRGSGFADRTIIAEVLEIDDEMKDLITAGATQKAIFEHAMTRGFCPIIEDAREKVDWGMTEEIEVMCALDQ